MKPPPHHCKNGRSQRNNSMKVFIVGLPKSGTTSTGELFRKMCLKVTKHASDLAQANGNFSKFYSFDNFDVITNSAEWYYPDIEKNHPGKICVRGDETGEGKMAEKRKKTLLFYTVGLLRHQLSIVWGSGVQ